MQFLSKSLKGVLTSLILLSCSMSLRAEEPVVTQAAEIGKFLTISDIHFNPFATCPNLSLKKCPLIAELQAAPAEEWSKIFSKSDNQKVSKSGHDTNYALLKSSMAEIKQLVASEKPDFAVYLGDALAHEFRDQYLLATHDQSQKHFQSFVAKTIKFLSISFNEVLPDTDIYPTIGNNDSYTGDYIVVPRGSFLRDTGHIYSSLLKSPENKHAFEKEYKEAGYYEVSIPKHPQDKLIVLDTVLFSNAYQTKPIQDAAKKQLVWLHEALASAKEHHQKVLLAFHIPIGIDVHKTVSNFFRHIEEFWMPVYNQAFRKELETYSAEITGILAGHIHMDSFQLLVFDKIGKIPVSITPAISPIFGNNPGMKVYTYHPDTFQLENFDAYYFPLVEKAEWKKEYDFNQIYQSGCNNCDLIEGMLSFSADKVYQKFYKEFYTVSTVSQPIHQNRNSLNYYACSIHAVTKKDYQECIRQP